MSEQLDEKDVFDLQDTTSDYPPGHPMRKLLDRSSLGSAEAVAARSTVTDAEAARVVARANELRRNLLRREIEALIRTPDGKRKWRNQGRSGFAAVVDVSRLQDALDRAYPPPASTPEERS